MDEIKKLHITRIIKGRGQIAEFRQSNENAHSPKFKSWKQRIKQSLGEVFGARHPYKKKFFESYVLGNPNGPGTGRNPLDITRSRSVRK